MSDSRFLSQPFTLNIGNFVDASGDCRLAVGESRNPFACTETARPAPESYSCKPWQAPSAAKLEKNGVEEFVARVVRSSFRAVRIRRLDDQMIVTGLLAIGATTPVEKTAQISFRTVSQSVPSCSSR